MPLSSISHTPHSHSIHVLVVPARDQDSSPRAVCFLPVMHASCWTLMSRRHVRTSSAIDMPGPLSPTFQAPDQPARPFAIAQGHCTLPS